MRKAVLVSILFLLLVGVFSAGCIQLMPEVPEEPPYTYGFYDKSPYYYPMDLEDHMTHYTNWQFDLDNATGFEVANRRVAQENRYVILSLMPGKTGCVPVIITAPAERDVVVSVGNHPENPQEIYPEGFSAVLDEGSVSVKAGETITAPLYISLAEGSTEQNHEITLITLEVESGARVGHWCLLVNDIYMAEF